jgi:hypothetical protein
MEEIIRNIENPLTIDELWEDINLRYERLSLIAEITNDINKTDEKVLFTTQFKGKWQNCGKMSHKWQIARLDVINSKG